MPGVRQSALRLIAAFDQERQIKPDWRAECGESDADRGVSTIGESPVKRLANIVDLTTTLRHPRGCRRGLRRFGYRQECTVIELRVPPRCLFPFTALGQLFQRIGAYRLQQPPPWVGAGPSRHQ